METTLNKNKEGYGYQYTDLAEIHRYLEENNMRYYQEVETLDGVDYIMTYRFIDGKWEEKPKRGCRVVNAILSGKSNPAQEQGSALTYARRYSLLMAFGLATDDDDAESLSINKEPTLEDAKSYVLTFGKNAGKKLGEIDKSYLNWLREYGKDPYIKKCVDLLDPLPSEEEQQEILELMQELHKLIEETNTDRDKLYSHYKVASDSEMAISQLKDAINKLREKIK